ncbi:MAG: hypothetical protein RIS18_1053 [Actinomycetota bacterium]
MAIAGIPEISLEKTALPYIEKPHFDSNQQIAIDHSEGPLLVTGKAGTGKTLVLAESVVHKVLNGIPSDKILIFCFSRHSARIMRKYLARRLPDYSVPLVATFHSFTHSVMQAAYNQGLVVENYAFSPLRLLSGPEQEVMINELIKGTIEDGSIDWPPNLRSALKTKGFVRQVRNLLARMRSLGMDPDQLIETGIKHENPNWIALGHFAEMYLDNLDSSETTDYGELVHRVNLLLRRLKSLEDLNITFTHFFVDEYQDIDPAQVRVLKSLVRPNKFLLAVGDKEQSIYQFRGSDYEAIDRFNSDFGNSKKIELMKNYRQINPLDLNVYTFDSMNSQSFHIANEIRRFKQENPESNWSDILVIVRNSNSINAINRALTNFAIPVNLQAEDLPLSQDPAARVILDCLSIAGQLALGNLNPGNSEVVLDLLKGPLINASPFELRETSRLLRKRSRENNESPLNSDQALYKAVIDPTYLLEITSEISQAVRKLGAILFSAADLIKSKARVEVAMWNIWNLEISEKYKKIFDVQDSEYKWSETLKINALRGGIEGRKADKDLDSILALFDAASRDDERTLGTRGVLNFLSDLGMQAFQAETLAQKPIEDDRVQIVTAHKSKGLEARFVIIPDVQADQWPSAKLRNNLLEVERLGFETVVRSPSRNEIIAEDIRLFEVAKSRSSQKLLISAVKSEFSDSGEPSSLITKILNREVVHISGFPTKALSLNSLVAELRKTGQSDETDLNFKKAIAKRLNKLRNTKDAFGRDISQSANPENWWATYKPSPSEVKLAIDDNPISLSGSGLATLRDCGLKWFLEKKAGANIPRQNAASIGSIVHALAQGLSEGEIEPNFEALKEKLDLIWPQLTFDTTWLNDRFYDETLEIITNLLSWHLKRENRKIIGSEVQFSLTMAIDESNPLDQVKISGYIDRLEAEVEDTKKLHIIDFKTSKDTLSKEQAQKDPQLGVYRLAVAQKALKIEVDPAAIDASASLVYLKHMQKNGLKELEADNIDENGIFEILKDSFKKIKSENFSAKVSPLCRTCQFARMCPAQPEGKAIVE